MNGEGGRRSGEERRVRLSVGFTGRRRALRRMMRDHDPTRHATRESVKRRAKAGTGRDEGRRTSGWNEKE